MKKLIRNVAMLIVGLSLTAFHATAGSYNLSVATSTWQGIYQAGSGGSPYIPAGAGVGWYAYAYGSGANADVHVSGGGISADVYAPSEGSANDSATTTSDGQVNILMYCAASNGGGAGAGVTINW